MVVPARTSGDVFTVWFTIEVATGGENDRLRETQYRSQYKPVMQLDETARFAPMRI